MRIVLFGLLVIFASVLDIFLSQIGVNPTTPAYSFVPLFMAFFVLRYNPKLYTKYFNSHSLLFFFIAFILALIYALHTLPAMDAVIIELTNAAITLLLYLFVYILFSRSKASDLKMFLWIALAVIFAGLLYDTVVGFKTSIHGARKGGFGVNPNITGNALKFLGFCLILLYSKNAKLRVIILVSVVLSIFLTFSRSGILGSIIMAVLLLLNNWKIEFNLKGSAVLKAGIKMVFVLGLAYFALATLAGFLQQQMPELREGDAGKRIDTLLFRNTGNSGGMTRDDMSQYGRKNILIMYTDDFMENPYGHGTGYTADKSLNLKDTHNFYLKMAVNYGFIGLLVLLLFFFMCIKRALKYNNYYYMVFTLMLMVECIASHNVFMERPTLIALAFMDAVLYRTINKSQLEQDLIS